MGFHMQMCAYMALIAKIRMRDKQGVYASSKREFSHERVISNLPLNLALASIRSFSTSRFASKIKTNILRWTRLVFAFGVSFATN